MDLGSRKHVVAIATQGRYGSSDWTSKYQLLYSDSQKNWRPYLQDGNPWVGQRLVQTQQSNQWGLQWPADGAGVAASLDLPS